MWELLLGERHHAKSMEALVQKYAMMYYDNGVSSRWYKKVESFHSVVYFFAAVIALLTISKYSNKEYSSTSPTVFLLSYSFLSFFLLNSLFVISISPITLGQPLLSRYLAISLPIAYILVIWFISANRVFSGKAGALVGLVIIWMYSSGHVNWAVEAYLSEREPESIFDQSGKYQRLSEKIEQVQCISARRRHVLRFKFNLIPYSDRGRMYRKLAKAPIVKYGNTYLKKRKDDCVSTLHLHDTPD